MHRFGKHDEDPLCSKPKAGIPSSSYSETSIPSSDIPSSSYSETGMPSSGIPSSSYSETGIPSSVVIHLLTVKIDAKLKTDGRGSSDKYVTEAGTIALVKWYGNRTDVIKRWNKKDITFVEVPRPEICLRIEFFLRSHRGGSTIYKAPFEYFQHRSTFNIEKTINMLSKVVYLLALLGYETGGGQGHDGNLFDDAASVLDNFFG
ncbi:hypothetical protein AVEN_69681-1 [Araneus ventricosus]|uniref:PiggyBac transposable element-derived protein domain-containing protein n=1 Tax=Araneus ventricosus TaxID=182803 RepID=A0A4Y2MCU7_ARAVE|nr:hypothetical protein AVEN_69681-1 [Araneus ventricosus]